MSELSGNNQEESHTLDTLDLTTLKVGESISGITSFEALKILAEDVVWEQDHTFKERPLSFGKRVEAVEKIVRGPFTGTLVFTGTRLAKNGIIIDENTGESCRGYLFENDVTFQLTGKPNLDSNFGLAIVHGERNALKIRAYDLGQKAFDVVKNTEIQAYHQRSKKMGVGTVGIAKSRPRGTTGHL